MKLAGEKKEEKQTKEERKTQDAAIWNDGARETSQGRSGTKRSERIKKQQAERERQGERQIRSRTTARELCCEPALKSLFYATEVVSSPMDTLSPDSVGKWRIMGYTWEDNNETDV